MTRKAAVRLLDRLHEAQNELYEGGAGSDLDRLLSSEVVWVIPGDNRIAGTYRGLDRVLAYFRGRRDIAGGTFRMTRRDILVGEGNRLAALTDGSATIGGLRQEWSTVGLYEVEGERIASCRLLVLDQAAFDAIWSV